MSDTDHAGHDKIISDLQRELAEARIQIVDRQLAVDRLLARAEDADEKIAELGDCDDNCVIVENLREKIKELGAENLRLRCCGNCEPSCGTGYLQNRVCGSWQKKG